MDAFEKWRKDYGDRMHAQGIVRNPTDEEAFRAGMRAAAEIVRQNPKEVALQVRPYEPISAENVSLLMDDAREACAALSLAILAEADK